LLGSLLAIFLAAPAAHWQQHTDTCDSDCSAIGHVPPAEYEAAH